MNKPKIHHTGVVLMPDVPLHVYAIEGSHFSVLIDTGITPMKNEILSMCDKAGGIRYVFITHAHADHIGCNRAVRDHTGATFLAGGALPWIEDYETHIREFCLQEETGDYTPGQAAEVRSIMDEPVRVDITLREGDLIRPGGETVLETIAVPGHKLEELAFLEHSTGILFMGDLFLALKAPFFHGFQTASGFHNSLHKIENLLESGRAKSVYAAHFNPLDAGQAMAVINETRSFLDQIRDHTLDAVNGNDLTTIWKTVCSKMHKDLEFRGYAMISVQLAELENAGLIRNEGGLWQHG